MKLRTAYVPGPILLAVAILLGFPPVVVTAQTEIRVATYNIKFLDAGKLPDEGNRQDKLRQVLELLEADVIGMQEIDDRAALEAVFSPIDWHLIIDDDSGNTQDLALAVRRPLEVIGVSPDLDAGDDEFLFAHEANTWFPKNRDVLAVRVRVPGEDTEFTVMVHHAKSRFGGRASTDFRREGASERMVQLLETDFHEDAFILLGDFNDAPDDRSLNILETGDPNATAGPEEIAGPFLVNLTEPLYAQGHVSFGRKSNDVHNGQINTVDPGARDRNNQLRGTDAHTGDQLFDQILVPPQMLERYVAGSAAVFDVGLAAIGNNTNRASDHLPVFADFVFGAEEEPPTEGVPALRIISLLPNPEGPDQGNEVVTIANTGTTAESLDSCLFRDRAENEFALSGSVGAESQRAIVMTTFSMPLNNSGDEIQLICDGQTVDVASYTAAQVVRGVSIEF